MVYFFYSSIQLYKIVRDYTQFFGKTLSCDSELLFSMLNIFYG